LWRNMIHLQEARAGPLVVTAVATACASRPRMESRSQRENCPYGSCFANTCRLHALSTMQQAQIATRDRQFTIGAGGVNAYHVTHERRPFSMLPMRLCRHAATREQVHRPRAADRQIRGCS